MSATYAIFTSPSHAPVPDHLPTLIVTPHGQPSNILYTYLHTNYNRENYLLTPSEAGDLCVAKLFPPPPHTPSTSSSSHGSSAGGQSIKCEASRNLRWSITNTGVQHPIYKALLSQDDQEQPLFQVSKPNPSATWWSLFYFTYAGHLIPPRRVEFGKIQKNTAEAGGGTRVSITGKSEEEQAVWKTLGEGNEDMVEWIVICCALSVLDDEIVHAAEKAGLQLHAGPPGGKPRLAPSPRPTPSPRPMPSPQPSPRPAPTQQSQHHPHPDQYRGGPPGGKPHPSPFPTSQPPPRSAPAQSNFAFPAPQRQQPPPQADYGRSRSPAPMHRPGPPPSPSANSRAPRTIEISVPSSSSSHSQQAPMRARSPRPPPSPGYGAPPPNMDMRDPRAAGFARPMPSPQPQSFPGGQSYQHPQQGGQRAPPDPRDPRELRYQPPSQQRSSAPPSHIPYQQPSAPHQQYHQPQPQQQYSHPQQQYQQQQQPSSNAAVGRQPSSYRPGPPGQMQSAQYDSGPDPSHYQQQQGGASHNAGPRRLVKGGGGRAQ